MGKLPLLSDIHFIGRACRLPGASGVEEFRHLLFENRCSVSHIPRDRWSQSLFYHPKAGTRGKSYSFAAGVLDDIWGFDPTVFNISPREARQMDPQQRVLLQVVWEALEDAGLVPQELAGKHVGVYVGCSGLDHSNRLVFDDGVADAYMMTGNTLSLVSNRISHAFDFRGPSMTVDTACSSSLIAMHLAEKAMLAGEIDMAIVAGVNMLISPMPFIGFSAARMLSQKGLCQPFSANADGYVRAEGAVALVLKRSDATQPVPGPSFGRLVGIDTNTDGRTMNVAFPSSESQLDLLRKMYDRTGIDPASLDFVEAHGTGTQVGDPVEAHALGTALGQQRSTPLPIGSVKSNIGHLEPASGVAGILKALISLEEKCFPASLHASEQNPDIDFRSLNLEVVTTNLDLSETERASFAGVSSFGFGGTNVHAIIEGPDRFSRPEASASGGSGGHEALLFTSAFSRESLHALASAHEAKLKETGDADAYAEHCGQALHFRGSYPQRLALVGGPADENAQALADHRANVPNPRVIVSRTTHNDRPPVFLFSGNGAQYPGMSLAACASDAVFRDAYDDISARFKQVSGWSLTEGLSAPTLAEDLARAEVAQPLLFADQVSLARALSARGLVPAAVLGHSGGEVAAACVSGVLDLDQALELIHQRSKSQMLLEGRGTMAALQVSSDKAAEGLAEGGFGGISIAAINSPKSVTIAGPNDQISAFLKFARRTKRWAAVPLKIRYPFHSPILDEIENTLHRDLEFIRPRDNPIPFISSVSGDLRPGSALNADYWWSNVREPVRFMDGMNTAVSLGYRAFLEISPLPVLTSYVGDCLGDEASQFVSTHSFERADTQKVNPVARTVARALVAGCRVDKNRIAPRPATYTRTLPGYPWNNVRARIDETPKIERHHGIPAEFHPLLGRELDGSANTWLSDLESATLPALADHVVGESAIAPGTFFADLAIAAAQRSLKQQQVELTDLDIIAPLSLSEDLMHEVRTQVSVRNSTLQISSRTKHDAESWRDHVNCRIHTTKPEKGAFLAPKTSRSASDQPGDEIYEMAGDIGLNYGPAFRRVAFIRQTSERTVEVVLKSGANNPPDFDRMALDPVATDAIFHGLVGLLGKSKLAKDRLAFVPVHISKLKLFQSGEKIVSGRIDLRRVGQRSLVADMACFNETGDLVASLLGTRFRAVNLLKDVDLDLHAFNYTAQPVIRCNRPDEPALPLPQSAMRGIFSTAAEIPALSPSDDANLLLEAAALRIAYDALSRLANPSGIVTFPVESIVPDQEAARHCHLYFANVVNLLADREMVEPLNEGCKVVPGIALPHTRDILEDLLVDRPDLVTEYAALIRLQNVLTDVLSGKTVPDAITLFGRHFLEGLASGSVFAARSRSLLRQTVLGIVADLPGDRTVRIAEMTDGKPDILKAIQNQSRMSGRELFHLTDPEKHARAGAPSAHVRGAVTMFEATRENLVENGPFDLVVLSQDLHGLNDPGGILADLKVSLAPDGCVVSVENLRTTFSDLIFGFERSWFARSATAFFPVSRRYEESEVHDMVQNAGLEVAPLISLPEGFGNRVAWTARRRTADESSDQQADISSLETGASLQQDQGRKIVHALLTRHRRPEIPLKGVRFDAPALISTVSTHGFRPTQPDPAPELFCVHNVPEFASPQELLENRILFFRKKIKDFAQENIPMWVVIPAGAGHSNGSRQTPGQAAIWAFLRTAQNEYPSLEIKCLDQRSDVPDELAARTLVELVNAGTPETEMLLTATGIDALRVNTGQRVVREAGAEPLRQTQKAVLDLPLAGRLEDIAWKRTARALPGEEEIEIEVAATGLNYRDTMWAMGILPEEALENGFAGPTLGIECSGVVVRKGARANRFSIGDRVVTFGPGCFSSHVNVHQDWAGRLAPDADMMAAATIPVAFFTAYYALEHLARITADDTVLLHGGAGGVGLAAIQIAKAKGARMIATAGSPVKRDLLSSLGVHHVLESRTLDFGDQIRELTGGAGVDVVLNSLAGEAMELSLNSLAPFGRFLELGKRDYYDNTSIGLRPLKENISYFGIDVDRLLASKPDLAKRLFGEMMGMFQSGDLTPLPYRGFPGNQSVEAFRLMQKSGHIGKIVVQPEHAGALARPAVDGFRPSPSGAHIVVGGLGGLGFDVANWLVKLGAKTVILCGRTLEPSKEVQLRLTRLRRRGVEVALFSCDVGDQTQVEDMLRQVRNKHAICGVIHSAMVLDDMPICDLSRRSLKKTLNAKVKGADLLDRLTRNDALDYFVLFSSIATLIGNHGQSAYVAANAYLEGVARQRRRMGFPALAIGWGPISDSGYLTTDKAKAALVRRLSGNVDFTSRQALGALGKLLSQNADTLDPVQYVTPMRWHESAAILETLKSPTYRKLWLLGQDQDSDRDIGNFRDEIAALPTDDAEERLTHYLLKNIAGMLQIPEKTLIPTQPVAELGMDSLMGIDLGLTLQKTLGDDIPMTSISETLSVRDIARKIVDHVQNNKRDTDATNAVRENLVAQHRAGEPDDADSPNVAAQ